MNFITKKKSKKSSFLLLLLLSIRRFSRVVPPRSNRPIRAEINVALLLWSEDTTGSGFVGLKTNRKLHAISSTNSLGTRRILELLLLSRAIYLWLADDPLWNVSPDVALFP